MPALLFQSGVWFYLASLAATSIVLCAVALSAWRFTARRSAPLRHGLLLSAVCLVAFSPLLVAVVMSTGLARWQVGQSSKASRQTAEENSPLLNIAVSETVERRAATETVDTEVAAPEPIAQGADPPSSAAASVTRRIFTWQNLLAALAALWVGGILVRLTLLGRGLLILAKLRRSLVKPNDGRVSPLFDRVAREVGIPRRTRLFDSPLAPAPLTFGLLRPIVVLPTDLAEQLSDEQLRLVLAHEAAHIARRDLYALVVQWLATSLFWWNPLLHAVNRRIERLREHICDDYAALLSGNGRGLAELLITLAEWSPAGRLHVSGATAIVDRAYDDLESRVSRLVADRSISTRLSWPLRGLLALFATSLVALSHLTTWSAEPAVAPLVEISAPVLVDEPGAEAVAEAEKFKAAAQMKLDEWLKQHPAAAARREGVIEQLRAHKSSVAVWQGELIVFIDDPEADDATLGMLQDVGPIHTLNIKRGSYTAAGCKAIARLTDLESLDLHQIDFSAAGFEQLAKLPQLRQLVLNGCPLSDEKLLRLKACQTLERVSIAGEGAAFTADGLAVFASLPAMKGVGVYGPMVTDEGLKRLAECKTLSNLAFGHTSVSDEGLRPIGEMKNLRYLMVSENRFTSAGFAHLAPLTLTDLVLRCPGLDDATLAVIGGMSALRNLQLMETAVSDDGLASLAGLVDLEILHIDSSQFTGAGLAHLSPETKLRHLTLQSDQISNLVFPPLHNFQKLRDLMLGAAIVGKPVEHPGITDEGLAQIPPLPALEKIVFTGTGITKPGVDALGEKLPGLKSVIVQDSPSYSARNAVWRPNRASQELARLAKTDSIGFMNRMSQLWMQAMQDTNTGLWNVTAMGFTVTDETVALLARVEGIGKLTLAADKCTEKCLDTVAKLKSLENLEILHIKVSDAGLAKLAGLPNLKSLSVREGTLLTDKGFSSLKDFRALESFSVTDLSAQITGRAFDGLASHTTLQRLHIQGGSLNDEAIERLASIPSLKDLEIPAQKITAKGWQKLSESKSISALTLDGGSVSDEDLRLIAGLEALEVLSLGGDRVTIVGLRHLQRAAHLRDLTLGRCPKLDDRALAVVGELVSLRELSIQCSSMTDKGLARLNTLVNLETLFLQNDRFSGAGLARLTALEELQWLLIHGPNVSNEVFAAVHQFPKLYRLDVGAGQPTDQSRVTNGGIKLIKQAPSLMYLILNKTAITEQGLAPLGDLPKLYEVTMFGNEGGGIATWKPPTRRKGPAAEQNAAGAAAAQERNQRIAELGQAGAEFSQDQAGGLTATIRGPRASDATVALLEQTEVSALTLGPGNFTAASFDSIAKLSTLVRLDLFQVNVTAADVEKIARLPNLKGLGLQCPSDDDVLEQVKNCKSLVQLDIWRPNRIGDRGLVAIAALPHLQTLLLSSDLVSDDGLQALGQCRALRDLSLLGTGFSGEGLRFLAACENLQVLSLGTPNVTAASLGHLKAVAKLDSLNLESCPQLGDDALAILAENARLQFLSLGGTAITDGGLAPVNRLVNLKALRLRNTQVSGTGLAALTELADLTNLDIDGPATSNEVFAHLHQFPQLRALWIGTGSETNLTGITDEGLALIGNVPNLTMITFRGSGITDAGLKSLRAIPTLTEVQFRWTPGVKQEYWRPKSPRP